jgi:putative FmdB family regulatory protein
MPLYEDRCTKCEHVFEWYAVRPTDESKLCPKCGSAAERIYSRAAVKAFQEFTTRNIDPSGTPIKITSQGQLSRLCNEFKLNHVDDPKAERPRNLTPSS